MSLSASLRVEKQTERPFEQDECASSPGMDAIPGRFPGGRPVRRHRERQSSGDRRQETGDRRKKNPKLRTPNSKLRTPNSKLRTPNSEPRTPNPVFAFTTSLQPP